MYVFTWESTERLVASLWPNWWWEAGHCGHHMAKQHPRPRSPTSSSDLLSVRHRQLWTSVGLGDQTQTFNSSLLAFRHVDMVKLTCWGSNWASHEEERRFKRLWMWVICWYHLLEFAQNVDLVKNDQCDPRNLNLAIISWRKMLHLAPVLLYRLCVAFSWWWGLP